MPYFFVGDEAFPLKPYLMRPYPGRQLTEQKSVFNYRTEAPTTYVQYVQPTLIDSLKDDGGTNRDGEWREIIQNDTNLTPIGRVGANISASATMALRDMLAEYLIPDAGAVS
ncbi:unnamed protein product [Acanthoscelides obtectus]|uniref:DDE Tnp4 domain-containing protein n=1 Tax=Acanthoscelides obtectus TaxID=200917 RepID=A0A9P0LNL3_ACAOB|nr:unnamed protein product [Acanthoscelides obtectus]CAK1657253.1 hypothetical protein AOBTE_LOCUS20249 [Acanthoscelides obtectus]